MSDTLRDVIAKLKAQQIQNPQVEKRPIGRPPLIAPAPTPSPVQEEEEMEDADMGDEFAEETPQQKPVTIDSQLKAIQEQVMSLHDNGIYRLETLTQLQQINKSLSLIAGVLVDLTGNGK